MKRDPQRYLCQLSESYTAREDASVVGDSVEGILVERREGIERVAARLSSLVETRTALRDEAIASIEANQLTIARLAHALYRPGQPVIDNPLYTRLRLEEVRLDRDRRQEYSGWWKDAAEVTKDLGLLTQRIEMARRNEDLLRGNPL